MKSVFENKTIMVTGGCGSIGAEIVRQLLQFDPEQIRILDHHENGHFVLSQDVRSPRMRHLIGDIRDRERVIRAMEGVDIVFHAAALKHVPFCEYDPFEAVNTNVIGTKNLIDVAIKERVEKFIGISTDKAVNPVNTMGATKLLSEKIITNAPIGKSHVKACCVRFGNVLATTGSVIPIFQKQIADGHELTITSPEMTRFFMSLSDAVRLVLKAAEMVEGGETFILKMGALRITDLAEVMVEELAPKHGKNPKDFTYKIIGVRPGEKLFETLMSPEEAAYTEERDDMLILRNSLLSNYGKKQIAGNMSLTNLSKYSSNSVVLLNKDQIRKNLYEKKILEEPKTGKRET